MRPFAIEEPRQGNQGTPGVRHVADGLTQVGERRAGAGAGFRRRVAQIGAHPDHRLENLHRRRDAVAEGMRSGHAHRRRPVGHRQHTNAPSGSPFRVDRQLGAFVEPGGELRSWPRRTEFNVGRGARGGDPAVPAEGQRRPLDGASGHPVAEVLVEPLQTCLVEGVLVDPGRLDDGFLVHRPQGQEEPLVGVGQQVRLVRRRGRTGVARRRCRRLNFDGHPEPSVGQNFATGIRGEDSESARPSAARRKNIFIWSTYCATDSRAMALSG